MRLHMISENNLPYGKPKKSLSASQNNSKLKYHWRMLIGFKQKKHVSSNLDKNMVF